MILFLHSFQLHSTLARLLLLFLLFLLLSLHFLLGLIQILLAARRPSAWMAWSCILWWILGGEGLHHQFQSSRLPQVPYEWRGSLLHVPWHSMQYNAWTVPSLHHWLGAFKLLKLLYCLFLLLLFYLVRAYYNYFVLWYFCVAMCTSSIGWYDKACYILLFTLDIDIRYVTSVVICINLLQ